MKPQSDPIYTYMLDRLPGRPKVAVVLGSGLSDFTNQLNDQEVISYDDIPGYPRPTVAGHVGEFIYGSLGNSQVLCARGRFHYYEGHPLEVVTLPIRVFKAVGCNQVVITNAAGCLIPEWPVGGLMLITETLDCTFRDSTDDPQPEPVYSPVLQKLTRKVASDNKMELYAGRYCWALGPTYETPAEIRDMTRLGGSAVGMSTVPEIRQAQQLGMDVLGISCLTNYAAGITDQPLSHEEVLETTERVKHQFANLVGGVISSL